MLESRFSKLLSAKLEGAGAKVFLVHGHAFQESGWPDLQVYHRIWTGHLELKTSSTMKLLQRICIRELRERGTHAYFMRLQGNTIDVIDHDCNVIREISFSCSGREILETLAEIG